MDTQQQVTETVETPGAKPEIKAAETPEQLLARIIDLERHAKNKEDEAERNRKKVEKLEAAEKTRADEQLTKEQRLEKELLEARAQVETTRAEAAAKLLKSAVLLKASEMGFEHPADAYALAGLDPATEYTDAQIEAALKTLTGRLPVKAQGAGVGSAKFPGKSGVKIQSTQKATRKFTPFL